VPVPVPLTEVTAVVGELVGAAEPHPANIPVAATPIASAAMRVSGCRLKGFSVFNVELSDGLLQIRGKGECVGP